MFSMRSQPRPTTVEMILHKLEWKGIVAGGNWGVGRKDGRGTYLLQCAGEIFAVLQKDSYPLKAYECGMSLVQMPQAWPYIQHLQRSDASDAQNHFLLQARLPVSPVQTR